MLIVAVATDHEGLLGFADFLRHLCQSQVPGVPESPGVYSQVTRHRVLPISNYGAVDIDTSVESS